MAASPTIEEQYKDLARDYDNAQKVYQDDLSNESKSEDGDAGAAAGRAADDAVDPASQPDPYWPFFPNRLLFAGGGLGAGLALGLGLALWLELRDKCIRTEADAEAALDLPMLVAVPWVVETAPVNGNGKGRFWSRKKQPEERKETARV